MVWGAMSSAGVSDLCFLKSSVNAAVYPRYPGIFHGADQLFGDNEFIFQQDLAPLHSAKSTQAWCENSHVHVLDWPAQLTSFESHRKFIVKKIVKKKLHKHQPNTCEQLKDAIKTCWNEVTPHECQQLIHSMLVALKLSSRLEVMQQNIDTLGL